MPDTAESLELEFQEEQNKKAQAKAKAEAKLKSETSGVPRVAACLLALGVTCACVLFMQPQTPRFLPLEEVQQAGFRPAVMMARALVEGSPVQQEVKAEENNDDEEGGQNKAEETQDEEQDTEDTKGDDEEKDDEETKGEVTPEEPTTNEPPKSIQDLALQLLGAEDAAKFFSSAICSKRRYKGKELWFFHHKHDELDFNPDPNYKFETLKDMDSGALAVDIGANLGDTAVLAHSMNRKLKILSLEPSPENYIFMRWNLQRNGVTELSEEDFGKSGKSGVLALHGGATKDGRKIELAFAPEHTKHAQMKSAEVGYGHEIPPSIDHSGVHADNRRYAGKWKAVTVPSYAVHEWLAAHNAPKIKWFKLDCEGCEYESLPDLVDGGFLKYAKVVTGEAHFRHVADLSCEHKKSDPICKDMISKVERTRQLMCKKYSFSCCAKTMPCNIYQEQCTKKR